VLFSIQNQSNVRYIKEVNHLEKIAVLLPVHSGDSPNYLRLSVDSIVQQNFNGDIHIIFCIDGPISNELQGICDCTPNAVSLSLQTNQGLAANLNQGIRYALNNDYPFVARMDADDIAMPGRIRKQHAFLIQNPNAGIVGSGCHIIDAQGTIIGHKIPLPAIGLRDLRFRCPVIHPSIMFRQSALASIGEYDPSYKKSQDYDYWFRAINAGHTIYTIQEPLLKFRYDQALISRRKKEQIYNLKIKYCHISSLFKFIYMIPNILILIFPNVIIRLLLTIKMLWKKLSRPYAE
jgi:glycosyltransferase involved in cell wall biosynthesis